MKKRFISIALVSVAIAIGCAGPSKHNDSVGGASSAIASPRDLWASTSNNSVARVSSLCGLSPKAPVCNIPNCTPDGWKFWPLPRDFSCRVPAGWGYCDGGEPGPPGQLEPNELGECIVSAGSLNPQFYVLGVIYAPPGYQGNADLASSVSYAEGSSFAHDTTVTRSFKQGVSILATQRIPSLANAEVPLSVSEGSGWSVTKSTMEGLTITKGSTQIISYPGSPVDGINHDEDEIYLWLNPRVLFAKRGNGILWTMGINPDLHAGAKMDVQFVKIGQLKGTIPMEQGVIDELAYHGITSANYSQLLAFDPFANGDIPVDTDRFAATTISFPYELNAPSTMLQLIANRAVSIGATSTKETSVTASLSAGNSMTWTQLTTSGSWTWTDTNITTDTTNMTEMATVLVRGHSSSYNGPSNIAVYFDTIYKTFMFKYITVPASIVGVVRASGGKLMAHQPVDLIVNGTEYHTITDSRGEYRFFGTRKGAAAVRVNKMTRLVRIGTKLARIDMSL